jgi:hypothetical protein
MCSISLLGKDWSSYGLLFYVGHVGMSVFEIENDQSVGWCLSFEAALVSFVMSIFQSCKLHYNSMMCYLVTTRFRPLGAVSPLLARRSETKIRYACTRTKESK